MRTIERVPLQLIEPWETRKEGNQYTLLPDKVDQWVALLSNKDNWIGVLIGRRLCGGRVQQLTGHHRVAALRILGWPDVPFELDDYNDVRAEEIYLTDNSLQWAPTAGMLINSAPSALARFRASESCESDAVEKLRRSLGLEHQKYVATLLEMYDAIKNHKLAEDIQALKDIRAAIRFWSQLTRWEDTFGEWLPLGRQMDALKTLRPDDVMQSITQVFYLLHTEKRASLPPEVLTKIARPKKTLDDYLRKLANDMAKVVRYCENFPDEGATREIGQAIEINYAKLHTFFVSAEEADNALEETTTQS